MSVIHPESKQYSPEKAQLRGRGEKLEDKLATSFTKDTAQKTGEAERTIRREANLAENLNDEIKEKVKELKLPQNEGIKLSRHDKDYQKKIIDKMEKDDLKHVGEADRKLKKEEYIKSAINYNSDNDKNIRIIHADFRQACQELADESIDHIITDPPYAEEFLPLWSDLSKVAARVLKPGGFYIALTGTLWLDKVINSLGEHLEYYYRVILKRTSIKKVYARRIYESTREVLIYFKPPIRLQEQFISEISKFDHREKDLHEWQQGKAEFVRLIKDFTKEGDLILDPMGGSGTTAVACRELNRRCVIIEKDKDTVSTIEARLAEYKEQQQEKKAV